MTDEQIIKALECCSKITFSCDGCPLKHLKYSECYEFVIRSALDLINRQKAEIERLEGLANHHRELINELNKGIAEAKAEAVKEFEERAIKTICEKVYAPTPVQSCIVEKCNQVIIETVKEMEGEG